MTNFDIRNQNVDQFFLSVKLKIKNLTNLDIKKLKFCPIFESLKPKNQESDQFRPLKPKF